MQTLLSLGLAFSFRIPTETSPADNPTHSPAFGRKQEKIVRTQIPPPTRFSSTLAGLEQAWVSYSLRFNTDFTLTSLRSYFEVTSVSRRSRFDSTSISLRFHFGLIANSLQSHFGLTSVPL
jgi:hypothetical protein